MAQKLLRNDLPTVVIATTSFYFRGSRFIRAGDTVLASDLVAKRCPELFRPFAPTHGTAAPAPAAVPEPDDSEEA